MRRKALEYETRETRKAERHFRDSHRRLRGWYSKRHQREQVKPEAPTPVTRTKEEQEKVDGYLDEHFAKMWNLQDYRKRVIQFEARHLHLIRGFLKDQKYSDIEATGTYYHPDRQYLLELAQEYSEDSDNVLKDRFIKWWDDAYDHIIQNDKRRAEDREKQVRKAA